jgi:hypothetical protein
MTAFSTAHTGGKASLATIADWLAIAVAIALPWSTFGGGSLSLSPS